MINLEEIWKNIKNFPDYMVSNLGRVKSFKKWRGTNERILTPGKDKDGYLYVNLYKNRKEYPKTIHRLVLIVFDPRENMEAFHI